MQLLGAASLRFVPVPARGVYCGPMAPVHRVNHRAAVGVVANAGLTDDGLADAAECADRYHAACVMA